MQKRICCIFGAGDYSGITIDKEKLADSFVIAADGGYLFLQENNIIPHLIVGDFDSIEIGEAEEHAVIRYPSEKDDTDMLLAIKEGMNRACNTFLLYGGTGGRFDHTLANIQTLAYLAGEGMRGYLIGQNEVITAIHNEAFEVLREDWQGKYISVFCNGKAATGVNLKGLKYSLGDAVVTADFAIGVSNEFAAEKAQISVENGTLIIVIERKHE